MTLSNVSKGFLNKQRNRKGVVDNVYDITIKFAKILVSESLNLMMTKIWIILTFTFCLQKPIFVETPRKRQAAIGQEIYLRCHAKGEAKNSKILSLSKHV